MMDTNTTSISPKGSPKDTTKRQRRTIAEKRRIVEETLVEGASVARIARAHGVNANQVFYWRKQYKGGRLGAAVLLPVTVTSERPRLLTAPALEVSSSAPQNVGTIHLQLGQVQVRIERSADPVLVRLLLECLRK
jgi:transposase